MPWLGKRVDAGPASRGRLLPDDAAIIAAAKTKPPRPVSRARRHRLQVDCGLLLRVAAGGRALVLRARPAAVLLRVLVLRTRLLRVLRLVRGALLLARLVGRAAARRRRLLVAGLRAAGPALAARAGCAAGLRLGLAGGGRVM